MDQNISYSCCSCDMFSCGSDCVYHRLQVQDELPQKNQKTREDASWIWLRCALRAFKFRGIISIQDICPSWLIQGLDENISYIDSKFCYFSFLKAVRMECVWNQWGFMIAHDNWIARWSPLVFIRYFLSQASQMLILDLNFPHGFVPRTIPLMQAWQ